MSAKKITHTPGWYISGQSEGGKYITVKSAVDAKTVCRVPFSNPDDPFPDDHDRARLIAAAPDMLAALRRIRDARDYCAEHGHYNDGPTGDQEFDDWAADVASEAIARATGKAED